MKRYWLPAVAVAGLLLSGGFSQITAQQPAVPPQYDAVQKLLHAAYPEIISEHLSMNWNLQDDRVAVVVSPARNVLLRPRDLVPKLIEAQATVGVDLRVVRFVATGALLEGVKNGRLRLAMEANPNWSEQQLQAKLADESAEYGPGRLIETDQKLESARWRVLGQSLSPWDVRFQWRERSGSVEKAKVGWVVQATAIAPDQRVVSYRLLFEPFAGRLVEMEEQ